MWFVYSVAFAATFADLQAGGWTDAGARSSAIGDVQVRRKAIGDVACAEGTALTSVSPVALLGVANDMASSIRWSSAPVAVSRELERSGSSFVLFQYFDAPAWTMSADRYWMLRGSVSWSGTTGVYRWDRVAASGFAAAQREATAMSASAVELPTNFGEWTFAPVEGGTQVRYRGCVDFGGRIPSGIQLGRRHAGSATMTAAV